MRLGTLILGWSVSAAVLTSGQIPGGLGSFEGHSDVGSVMHKGSVECKPGTDSCSISGSGLNMWGASDAFHFVWRKAAGDVSITADVEWATSAGNAHKKAGPILRAGLGSDDAYADLITHGDGTIALQYRKAKGETTAEIRTSVKAPATLRLERHGNVISGEIAPKGGVFQPLGALTVELPRSVYAGLAVCAHDAGAVETALFSKVAFRSEGASGPENRAIESTLETVNIETGQRRIVWRERAHFEAPNWSTDGHHLFYNGGGRLRRISTSGGSPQLIDTGAVRVNNDHGLSPDGKWMAISGSTGDGPSQIYIVAATGGQPRLVVKSRPSYWHGWSPDGKTLAYCAERNGNYDVYTIAAKGGEERRVTTAEGLDDGPEYTPDGQWIYFNSERTGLMQIWRTRPDGTGQELVSRGANSADWFPHPSPDGRWIVYLAYDKSVKGHPANKDVVLKIMPAGGGDSRLLASLFGGQGTINVPSWSPDSKQVAFVSYRLLPSADGSVGQAARSGY